jgi:F0F1-type ATP synthase assembly protein I
LREKWRSCIACSENARAVTRRDGDISEEKKGNPPRKKSAALESLVQVESLIQLALVLPVATVVGLLIGVGLDKWLHQHWIYIAGMIVGAAAGFVQIFRTVLALSKAN